MGPCGPALCPPGTLREIGAPSEARGCKSFVISRLERGKIVLHVHQRDACRNGASENAPGSCSRPDFLWNLLDAPDSLRYAKHRRGQYPHPGAKGKPVPGNPQFGEYIRRLRELKKRDNPDFSLRRFARLVEISPTLLSKMETGEFSPPGPDKIIRMAELLGEDPDELLARAGKVDPDLNRIIREKPRVYADFLRTAASLAPDQLKMLSDMVNALKPPDGEGDGR